MKQGDRLSNDTQYDLIKNKKAVLQSERYFNLQYTANEIKSGVNEDGHEGWGKKLCTYSTANGHKQLSHCFGIVYHDGFNGTIQHFDFLGPLLLLIFKDILLKNNREEKKKMSIRKGIQVLNVRENSEEGQRWGERVRPQRK